METFNKSELAALIVRMNYSFVSDVPEIVREINNAIQYAWDNWDEGIIYTYFEGEKPSIPTKDFINEWVENQDFESYGFDVEYLSELF